MDNLTAPVVVGVSKDSSHRFSKQSCSSVTLLEGLGVEGDAHLGVTVQHRSRVAVDPTQPNLRQVHLIHSEFFDEARSHGYELAQGDLGENVLTAGLDLLALPRDTRLHLGPQAVVRITGLRTVVLSERAEYAMGALALHRVRAERGTMTLVARGIPRRSWSDVVLDTLVQDGPRAMRPVDSSERERHLRAALEVLG